MSYWRREGATIIELASGWRRREGRVLCSQVKVSNVMEKRGGGSNRDLVSEWIEKEGEQ